MNKMLKEKNKARVNLCIQEKKKGIIIEKMKEKK